MDETRHLFGLSESDINVPGIELGIRQCLELPRFEISKRSIVIAQEVLFSHVQPCFCTVSVYDASTNLLEIRRLMKILISQFYKQRQTAKCETHYSDFQILGDRDRH